MPSDLPTPAGIAVNTKTGTVIVAGFNVYRSSPVRLCKIGPLRAVGMQQVHQSVFYFADRSYFY
jgi:hypothetical protein